MATGTNIDIPKLNGFEACIMNISKCGRFTKIKKNERITVLKNLVQLWKFVGKYRQFFSDDSNGELEKLIVITNAIMFNNRKSQRHIMKKKKYREYGVTVWRYYQSFVLDDTLDVSDDSSDSSDSTNSTNSTNSNESNYNSDKLHGFIDHCIRDTEKIYFHQPIDSDENEELLKVFDFDHDDSKIMQDLISEHGKLIETVDGTIKMNVMKTNHENNINEYFDTRIKNTLESLSEYPKLCHEILTNKAMKRIFIETVIDNDVPVILFAERPEISDFLVHSSIHKAAILAGNPMHLNGSDASILFEGELCRINRLPGFVDDSFKHLVNLRDIGADPENKNWSLSEAETMMRTENSYSFTATGLEAINPRTWERKINGEWQDINLEENHFWNQLPPWRREVHSRSDLPDGCFIEVIVSRSEQEVHAEGTHAFLAIGYPSDDNEANDTSVVVNVYPFGIIASGFNTDTPFAPFERQLLYLDENLDLSERDFRSMRFRITLGEAEESFDFIRNRYLELKDAALNGEKLFEIIGRNCTQFVYDTFANIGIILPRHFPADEFLSEEITEGKVSRKVMSGISRFVRWVDKDFLTRMGATRDFVLNWDHKLLTTTFTIIKFMQLHQQIHTLKCHHKTIPEWSPEGYSWRSYPEF